MYCLTPLQPYTGPRLHAFTFPATTALFAVGDVHGQAHKLRELLEGFACVPTPGMERVLVFTGDLPDRGPDTLGTFAMAAQARGTYGFDRVVYLPGNHELMMLAALAHLCAGGSPKDGVAWAWLMNGGAEALAEAHAGWADHPQAAAEAFVQALPLWEGHPLLDALRAAPSHLRVGDVLCVHAGVQPKRPLADTLDLPATAHLDPTISDRHWAWVRRPFLEWPFGWTPDGRPRKGDATPGVLVVHGHTAPAEVARAWVDSPERLLKGLSRVHTLARLNLDGGAARGMLVAGAVFTAGGWQMAAADGHG